MTLPGRVEPEAVSTRRKVFNFLAFQAGWFGCALSAGQGYPMAGPVLVLLLILLHLTFCKWRLEETILIGIVSLLGGTLDVVQWRWGVSIAPVDTIPPLLAPVWFTAMYANFATMLRYSLAWLARYPWLAVLFGATGGPLTYRAGAGFGAIEVIDPEGRSLLVLAVVWGAITPGFFMLDRYLRSLGGPND